MLSMVLMNKWVMELGTVCRSEMAEVLAMILDALSHLKSSFSVDLLLHVYASLLKLLLSFATRNGEEMAEVILHACESGFEFSRRCGIIQGH